MFSYDPATGVLLRIGILAEHAYVTRKRWLGKPAGTLRGGYLCLNNSGKAYKVHRIIWLMVHGDWPVGDIDHINGIKDDNRLCNLRDVSRAENMRNKSRGKTNETGVTGVQRRRGTSYRAFIQVNRKMLYLYNGPSFNDAVEARKAGEKKFDFHENHGRPPAI